MKNRITAIFLTVFTAVFFISCALLGMGMFIPNSSAAAEGAGEMPHLMKDGEVNDDFGDEFEKWFSKSFAFRGAVVDAFTRFRADVLTTGNDQVIIGKDGFLFFEDTVDSYTGRRMMTDSEISDAAQSLLNIQNYSEERGAEFLFVCAPNKATVYHDKMPERYRRLESDTDLDRLYAELETLGVNSLDLRRTLRDHAADELVYHKRDTHWNGLGARYALEEIMRLFGLESPDFGEGTLVHDFEGDLDSLLYPGHTEYDDDIVYDIRDRYSFTSAYSNPMNMSISARGAGMGSAVFFRDSFANALIPLASSAFGETRLERANPYRLEQIEKCGADYVIVLIAERNLRDLIGSDARAGE